MPVLRFSIGPSARHVRATLLARSAISQSASQLLGSGPPPSLRHRFQVSRSVSGGYAARGTAGAGATAQESLARIVSRAGLRPYLGAGFPWSNTKQLYAGGPPERRQFAGARSVCWSFAGAATETGIGGWEQMRRTSALSICVVALLVAGAVPASASQVVILKTKTGGVAQPGAPARLWIFVNSEVGAGCAEVTGSLAVNGKKKDKATFSAELVPNGCGESLGGKLTGPVSAVEPTTGQLVLKAPQATFRLGECFYRLPRTLSGEYDSGQFGPQVSTTATTPTPAESTFLPLHRIPPSPNSCPQGPSAEIMFALSEPNANEIFEAEFVRLGKPRRQSL
jgi:hypothetical protein